MRERITSRQQAQDLLIKRAAEDDAFRQQLLANPKATISRELGIQFQDEVKIHVIEETAYNLSLLLPAKPPPARALAETELAAVVGGITLISSMPSAEKARLMQPMPPPI